MDNKHLLLELFESWMNERYPRYYIITGSIIVILGLILFASLILIFFIHDWWRLTLFSVGSLVILKFVMKLYLTKYFEEFTKELKKLNKK